MAHRFLTADTLLPYRHCPRVPGRLRIFCFHHAGGDPSAYRELVHQFAPEFDLQPVRLPREGVLPSGGRSDDVHALVEAIGRALSHELATPCLFFGHSMGAVLAAELTAWLERRGRDGPRLLVVSARSGVNAAHVGPDDRWNDDAMIGWMTGLGATPAELFDNPEMRRFILGAMRHDLRLLRTYRARFATVSTPILVLGGRDDPEVTLAELDLWRHRTTGGCRLRLFPGGHFYLYPTAREIVAAIEQALSCSVAPASDGTGGVS